MFFSSREVVGYSVSTRLCSLVAGSKRLRREERRRKSAREAKRRSKKREWFCVVSRRRVGVCVCVCREDGKVESILERMGVSGLVTTLGGGGGGSPRGHGFWP